MVKITRHGGLSHEPAVRVLLPGVAEVVGVAAGPVLAEQPSTSAAELEKEESWAGSSSETSPAKPPKTDEPSKPSPRKRARTAGGPSGSTKASGTARTGTTSGPETGV